MSAQNKALRIGVITAAVLGTVAIPATALAASATGTGMRSMAGTTAAAVRSHLPGSEDMTHPLHGGGPAGQVAQAHLQALATALGKTPEALKAAMEAARTETKPATKPTDAAGRQAVEDAYLASLAGKLGVTVDALKSAMAASRPVRPAGGPEGRGGAQGQAHLQALATALGKTPEALKAAIEAARTETTPATKPTDAAGRQAVQDAYRASLAGKLGVTVDALKSAMAASRPAPGAPRVQATPAEQRAKLQQGLAQMVTNGRITQAQATQILADLDAGKPVGEVLKQYMPQLGGAGGDHGRGPGPGSRGPGGPRG